MAPTAASGSVGTRATVVVLLLVALVGLSLSAGAGRASAATGGDQVAAFAGLAGRGALLRWWGRHPRAHQRRRGRGRDAVQGQGIGLHEPGPVRRIPGRRGSRCRATGAGLAGSGPSSPPRPPSPRTPPACCPATRCSGVEAASTRSPTRGSPGSGNVWDAIGVNQPVQTHTMAYLSTVYSYDGAMRFWGPTTTSGGLVTPVVGLASTPDGTGYWLTDAAGRSVGPRLRGHLRLDGRPCVERPDRPHRLHPGRPGLWLVASAGACFRSATPPSTAPWAAGT